MTDVEMLLETYRGPFVAVLGDGSCMWSLCNVDFVKRTAWVVNGCYHIEWDDTDMYYRDNSNKLVWMFEIEPGFQIVRVREMTLNLPDGYFLCQNCSEVKLEPADGPYEGVCETCYDVYLDWLYEDLETSTEIKGVKQWLDQRNELKPGSPDGAESKDCSV